MRRGSFRMTSQSNPPSNNNKENNNQLDNTKQILKSNTPFQSNGVDKKSSR